MVSYTIFAFPKEGKPRTTETSKRAGTESGLPPVQRRKRPLEKRIVEAENQLLKASLNPPKESESSQPTKEPFLESFPEGPEFSNIETEFGIGPFEGNPVQSDFSEKEKEIEFFDKDPDYPISSKEKDLGPIKEKEPENSQSKETITSTEMSDKRMVLPGSKDAPRFKASQPEELRRFIRRMEDLWTSAGITSDDEKKAMIGKYADRDSEEEWYAFDSFEKGTWEEFKEELISNYPEAAAAERGTPARIRQICAETSKIRLGDMPALYRFRRAFMAEAKKLRQPPEAMSNRELVEMFIECLSEALRSAVFQFLGNRVQELKPKEGTATEQEASSSKGKEPEGSTKSKLPRRPEDKYDLDDVCKAAIQVSENSQGMVNLMRKESSNSDDRDVFVYTQPVSESKVLSAKVEELEGVQALERDRLVSMNKTIESRMGGLEELLKALVASNKNQGICKGDCKNSNCKSHENNTGPTQKWGGKSMENERCFWCGLLGHFQADCEDQKNQIRQGNIKVNPEGKLRLKDGSFIPNYPAGATLKERVERHYSKKPSQYYYGEYEENDPPSSASGVLSQLLGVNTSDTDRRILAQFKAELDLRKREEALELKQKMLEQSEKKVEQASGVTRSTNVLELLELLTDEDLAALKAAKSGFN